MQIVVAYDVVDDRRRGRLHKALRGLLRPVQKSVFEGALDGELAVLLARVSRAIDHEVDTVRVYRLCRACRHLTILVGTSVPVPSEAEDVIV